MIIQDVMLTYNRKTKEFRVYIDGHEKSISGGMSLWRVFALLQEAVENGCRVLHEDNNP